MKRTKKREAKLVKHAESEVAFEMNHLFGVKTPERARKKKMRVKERKQVERLKNQSPYLSAAIGKCLAFCK